MSDLKKLITDYHSELENLFNLVKLAPITEAFELLKSVRLNENCVYVAGNGGSAASASHFVVDLMKNTRKADLPNFKAICLNDNVPAITAFANDESYDVIFKEPLKAYFNQGDVFVAISTSGNSPNIVEAAKHVKARSGKVIVLTGPDGGELKAFGDVVIKANTDRIEHMETHHLAILQLFVILSNGNE